MRQHSQILNPSFPSPSRPNTPLLSIGSILGKHSTIGNHMLCFRCLCQFVWKIQKKSEPGTGMGMLLGGVCHDPTCLPLGHTDRAAVSLKPVITTARIIRTLLQLLKEIINMTISLNIFGRLRDLPSSHLTISPVQHCLQH